MSMTVAARRPDACYPVMGSHGPLTQLDDEYHLPGTPRTLDPTPEQEREAGRFEGPNMSQERAKMVFRSLGMEIPECGYALLDPHQLLRAVTLARAVAPVSDDGMPGLQQGNRFEGGVRPGYFADCYEQIAEVCEAAIAWGVPVSVD